MTKDEMADLKRGDLVRHQGNGRSCVVTSNYGNRVTAVDSFDITNPDEWDIVELYCETCSKVVGTDAHIFHKPPICHTRKK